MGYLNRKLNWGASGVLCLFLLTGTFLNASAGELPKKDLKNPINQQKKTDTKEKKKSKTEEESTVSDSEENKLDDSSAASTDMSATSDIVPSLIVPANDNNQELATSTEETSAGALTKTDLQITEDPQITEDSQVTADSTSNSGEKIEAPGEDPETGAERAKKTLTDLVDRADKNIETSVASSPEELKSGAYNPNDSISSLSSITYHTNNEAICLKSKGGGKADGAICEEWLDKEISSHGSLSDSSPLERSFYQMWEGAKNKISESAYKIWDIALKAKETLFDLHGRLNTEGLAKFELNKEATQVAQDLGTKSAEQALRLSLGDLAPKAGEVVAPPPEMLRAISANISRAIVNHATSKWSEIQTAKKGVEVLKNAESDEKQYKAQVENGENVRAAGEERLLNQAPLDTETQGISLEERISRAEALKNVGTETANPTFEGDKLVSGDPNKERIDEWAYRATVEQMANPFISTNEIQRPQDIQLSERQIASQLAVGSESPTDQNQNVTLKALTPKQQIELYNRQLEIAARNMEAVAAESSSFVNTAEKIRSNKLKEGETILTINDLTPAQKKSLNPGKTNLSNNPNTKVEIPRTASQLTVTRY